MPISSAVRCTECSALTYIGCNTLPRGDPSGHVVAKTITLSWCCDAGKEFTIWVLLCCFDQERATRQAHHDWQSRRRFQAQRGRSFGNIDGGVGYGYVPQDFYSGYYSQGSRLHHQLNNWSEQALPDSTDPITEQSTALLAKLLPTIARIVIMLS